VVVETPMTPKIFLKRVYETPSPQDGRRILVDRLWPRGVSKEAAQLDGWMKDVAPSTELRKWFDHRPERWPEFRRRYICELKSNPSLHTLREMVARAPVTLLYAARDTAHNEAVVLAEQLSARRIDR
jgi:uncharacterized protein YeaO (DUF488 family)